MGVEVIAGILVVVAIVLLVAAMRAGAQPSRSAEPVA